MVASWQKLKQQVGIVLLHYFLGNMVELTIETSNKSHGISHSVMDTTHYYWFCTIYKEWVWWHLVMSEKLMLSKDGAWISSENWMEHLPTRVFLLRRLLSLVILSNRTNKSRTIWVTLSSLSIFIKKSRSSDEWGQASTRFWVSVEGLMQTSPWLSLLVTKTGQSLLSLVVNKRVTAWWLLSV